MKKIYCLLYLVTAILCAACTNEEDDLFDTSSALRADEAIEADLKILTDAANGWLMEYYPEAQQSYGGYNILLKFGKDGKVTAASELYDGSDIVTSLYSVKQSAGIVLSFDTYNEIFHFFSDPGDPAGVGGNGYGLEGDYDFLILEATAEKVTLKGKKTGGVATLTPMKGDWEEYIDQIQSADEIYSEFVAYKYVEGSFKADIKVTYRNMNITYMDDSENQVSINAPYIITSEGELKFHEQLILNGKTINALKYVPNEQHGVLVPTNDVAAVFTPSFPLSYFFMNEDWYFSFSRLGNFGQPYWTHAKEKALDVNGITLDYALFTPYNSSSIVFYWGSNLGNGMLLFDVQSVSDKKVTIAFAYNGNSLGVTFYNNLLWDYVIFPFDERTFILSADDDENPTFITLSEEGKPNNVITLLKEEITDPFTK
ncbi:MAG: DUF4302 domain-containing protein [Oscillibacter sp.]|nr:DUF4302 domain-containing protein [Oscillibacter sp.]